MAKWLVGYRETLNKDNDNMFASSLVEDCIMYTLCVHAYKTVCFWATSQWNELDFPL